MMQVALVLVSLIFLPRVADATPVFVTFAWDTTYGNLEFGPDLGFARIVEQGLGPDEEVRLWGPTGEFQIVGGTFNLVTGPLLDITPPTAFERAVYSHAGGGSVSVVFDLLLPGGAIHHGTFDAPLGPYTIFISDFEGGAGGGYTDGLLGAGLFDKGTANLLGINRHTIGGSAGEYLDSFDAYPDPYRLAKSFGYMDVEAVPEPASLLLLSTGGLGLVAKRLRRRKQKA